MNVLLWFRNDLRLHDNELLFKALQQKNSKILPFYCFDERQIGPTAFSRIGKFLKCGYFRTKFQIESIQDLRNAMVQKQGQLMVKYGKPEQLIPELVKQYNIQLVLASKEVCDEELQVENLLAKNLKQSSAKIEYHHNHTLIHPQDLPCKVSEIPIFYTSFRQMVEGKSKTITARELFPTPTTFSNRMIQEDKLNDLSIWGNIPSLKEFGFEKEEQQFNQKSNTFPSLQFKGGESYGVSRVQDYIWDKDCLKEYKVTRNGMLGMDYSSKFSIWLSNGCISPRFIYKEIQKYEKQRVANESTYWLIFELLWRDFFRFFAQKIGKQLFFLKGLQNEYEQEWSQDAELFEIWRQGQTGHPLVDANMRELNQSGFMSNRGRQNVASFLVKDLQIDWRLGAEYFESMLIDYDVHSNWGNWLYASGVGNDPRGQSRYFNVIKQAMDYDPNGEYIKAWLPELSQVPLKKLFTPFEMTYGEQLQSNCVIGKQYPKPIRIVKYAPSTMRKREQQNNFDRKQIRK